MIERKRSQEMKYYKEHIGKKKGRRDGKMTDEDAETERKIHTGSCNKCDSNEVLFLSVCLYYLSP